MNHHPDQEPPPPSTDSDVPRPERPPNAHPPPDQAARFRPGQWIKTFEEAIWRVPDETSRGLVLFLQRWLQILDRSLRGFLKHGGSSHAASLTYTTLLTIIPLLALLLSVLKGFGFHDAARDALMRLPIVSELKLTVQQGPSEPLVPTEPSEPSESSQPPPAPSAVQTRPAGDAQPSTGRVITAREFIDRMFQQVDQIDMRNLGALGLGGLLLVVLSLMSKIESVMNDAWFVHRSRSLGRKLADYMNLMVVLLLLLIGLSTTAWLRVFLHFFDEMAAATGLDELRGLLLRLLTFPMVWAAFFFLYLYMPNTHVRWRSAFAGGVVAGTFFQLIQLGFIWFNFLFHRYGVIYGAFAIILVLLIWVYVSWAVVLWGVEICSTHQNLRDWRRQRRAWHGTPCERETLALRLAALLARPLLRPADAPTMDAGDLSDALMIPPGPVSEMVELFQTHGLAIQLSDKGTYILGRSPETLSVLDVLRLARHGRLQPGEHTTPNARHESADALRTRLGAESVKDLAARPLEQIQTIDL